MKANTSISLTLLIGLASGCSQPLNVSASGGVAGDFGGSTGVAGGIVVGGGPVGAFGDFAEPVVIADSAPPPVSGGTLAVAASGHLAVVSDPDRDQIVVVDIDAMHVSFAMPLSAGDEPGRIVEDGAGHMHIALRGAGAILTLDPRNPVALERRDVCTHPRGLAYDSKSDLVHVACAGGELISLPAQGGPPARSVVLDSDLRDVVVDGDKLLVSRFRSAELLVVGSDGVIANRLLPPPVSFPGNTFDSSGTDSAFAPAVAWRTTSAPGGGALMVYQQEQTSEVQPAPGGYGGTCGGIVRTAVSMLRADGKTWTVVNLPAVLPVDVALAPGGIIDVISASTADASQNFGSSMSMVSFVPPVSPDPVDKGPCMGGLDTGFGGSGPGTTIRPEGQLVAIGYAGTQRVLQTREPSTLVVGSRSVVLPGESRKDTGHQLFHLGTSGGLACASCHPEGREDGHIWTFAGLGARRTQALGGGILGTEPFHWSGDMNNFDTLAHEVFGNRMSGPNLQEVHIGALAGWIDRTPALKPNQGLDSAAVERGHTLFQSADVGCVTCHAGARMTNNKTVDVGTGGFFQVPSLTGVAWRAPYLHSGCAPTLEARFTSCGGGEAHGHTASLSTVQRNDLITYLKSL